MNYLKTFSLLSAKQEEALFLKDRRRIHVNYYPVGIFPLKKISEIEFDDITIFYGDNGSGKSTLLNIIAEKLKASRKNIIDKGSFFYNYVNLCNYELSLNKPNEIAFISSDDVFDYLLNLRAINLNVNRQKERLSQEYLNNKYNPINASLENYQLLKDQCDARAKTNSAYVRERLVNNNIIEQSNGESALMFWQEEINEFGIYILDEPENSLSAENQLKLKQFIEDSARFYNCQFIISTHSPFLLNLKNAKIYDLDESPVCIKKWKDLKNVQLYYNFFQENEIN